jgi:VIT1/CCC1 family predicted Fe2+/Mn2+ transporter
MSIARQLLDAVRPAPRHEGHHRDITGGMARAAVFGVSDGLVSNIAVILGVAGADASSGYVRLAGVASLVGGAVSMAFGEWNSMTAQRELLERELDMERRELIRRPHVEEVELAHIYEARGIDPGTARELAGQMMRDPEMALETHAREELGIDPSALGAPLGAAVSSFVSFALGALIPLIPWLFGVGTAAVVASVVLASLAALIVGAALAGFTGRPRVGIAIRQLALTALPAAAVFGIGKAIGISVG